MNVVKCWLLSVLFFFPALWLGTAALAQDAVESDGIIVFGEDDDEPVAAMTGPDRGRITIISNFTEGRCGLKVELFDGKKRRLGGEDYLKSTDQGRVIFQYEPQRWRLPISEKIYIRTQFPALSRSGCRMPPLVRIYSIKWKPNTVSCYQISETLMAECSQLIERNAQGMFHSTYPPRRRSVWDR